MLQKSEVLISANAFFNQKGYAVTDAVPILVQNLVDIQSSTDMYFGELRLQGLDGKVGDIELRGQLPTNPSQFEEVLKTTIAEKESKYFGVIFFNKIQKCEDLNAYFSGYRLVTAPLAIN